MKDDGRRWDDCRAIVHEGGGLWRVIFYPQDRGLAQRYVRLYEELLAAGGFEAVQAWSVRARELVAAVLGEAMDGLEEEISAAWQSRRQAALSGQVECERPVKLEVVELERVSRRRGRR